MDTGLKVLKKQDVMGWTSNRFSIATNGGLLKHSSEPSGSIKHEDFLNYLRNYELLKRGLPHVVSWLAG
jgi:hypothetical protein